MSKKLFFVSISLVGILILPTLSLGQTQTGQAQAGQMQAGQAQVLSLSQIDCSQYTNTQEKLMCTYFNTLLQLYVLLIQQLQAKIGNQPIQQPVEPVKPIQPVQPVQPNQPSITVLSPNGGETYTTGQRIPISFKTNLDDKQTKGITLQLYKGIPGKPGSVFIQNIVTDWIGGSPYFWTIPQNIEEGEYTIYASASVYGVNFKEGGISDTSDNVFYIKKSTTQLPSITVISPNGGEVFDKEKGAFTASWQNTTGKGVDIYLLGGDSTKMVLQTIAKNFSGNSYPVQVDPYLLQKDVNRFYLRVCEVNTNNCDDSDNTFSINALTTQQLTINNSSLLPSGNVGKNYAVILNVSGGPVGVSTNSYNWSISSGSLPNGLYLGASDYGEMIIGTPTAAGTYNFTINVSYGLQSGSKQFTLVINPAETQTYIQPSITILSPLNNQILTSPINISWTETPMSANTNFSIEIKALESNYYAQGTLVFSTTLTTAQANCANSDKCSYPVGLLPGKYSLMITDNNVKGGVSSSVVFEVREAYAAISYFTASQTVLNSGDTTNFQFGGKNINYYDLNFNCSVAVQGIYSNAPGGLNVCNTTQRIPSNSSNYSIQFINDSNYSSNVIATLSAYDINGKLAETKSVTVTVNPKSTVSSPSNPFLSINKTSFLTTDTWQLNLTGAQPNQQVYICAIDNYGGQSCTPVQNLGLKQTTDSNGNWSASDSWNGNDSFVGTWKEWIIVGGTLQGNQVIGGTKSNEIQFTISKPQSSMLNSLNQMANILNSLNSVLNYLR
jgi:hypothetical protein